MIEIYKETETANSAVFAKDGKPYRFILEPVECSYDITNRILSIIDDCPSAEWLSHFFNGFGMATLFLEWVENKEPELSLDTVESLNLSFFDGIKSLIGEKIDSTNLTKIAIEYRATDNDMYILNEAVESAKISEALIEQFYEYSSAWLEKQKLKLENHLSEQNIKDLKRDFIING
jgi:hypothetical protein